MRTRVLFAVALLIPALVLVTGCSTDNSERERVVCEVASINGGGALVSAYFVDGGDGYFGPDLDGNIDDKYTVDVASVLFHARPYDTDVISIPQDGAYSSFIITGYNLTWVPSTNAPAALDMTPYNVVAAPVFLQVPVGDDAAVSVMIADRALKEAIGTVLGTPWNFSQDFTALAQLQFIGHASGDEHEVVVNAGLPVAFTFATSD